MSHYISYFYSQDLGFLKVKRNDHTILFRSPHLLNITFLPFIICNEIIINLISAQSRIYRYKIGCLSSPAKMVSRVARKWREKREFRTLGMLSIATGRRRSNDVTTKRQY